MPPIPHVEPATVQVTMVSGAIWIPPSSVTTDPRYAVLLRGLPNYQDLLLRKLGGVLIAVGSVFELTVTGNRCAFRIESINDCRDIIVARVNRTLTRIVILPGAVPIERTPTGGIDVLVKNLTQLIVDSYSNANAHYILNIPPIKTALIHGAAGIGKATLVKTVCLTLGCNLHALSISTVLTVKDQVDEEEFGTIDPVKMIFDRAKMSAPSVIMIKDLDLLCRDSTVDSSVKSSIIKILLKEIDGLGSNEKVFLIGISRNRSKLPEILRKPELFQYDLPVPVPSRPQRELILKAYLSVLNLHPMASAQDVVGHYANEIGQKTSGYVARDLVQLCRSAVLHAMRRRDIDHKDVNEMDVLSRGMAELRVAEAVKADVNSMSIEWRDFEYALSISKPSQQVEFESTLPKRSWEDIGGYAAIKKRMEQVVILPLLKPEAYRNLGISPPSGLLLYGPSGCGKTILVQALASQSVMNVIAIKGPEIFSKYLGETENTLRRLFSMARQIAPCIIFFDEMDSIGMKRERDAGDGTSGINERVLSTLLNEMDGVEGRRGVFVIGCTNRPNQIDDAILRPGRLDQLLYVGLPDETDRKSILTAITRRVPVASDVSINLLARQTEQLTGSDLETLFREAAIRALRENIDMSLVHWRHIEPVLAKMAAAVKSSAGEDRLELFRKFQERAKG